MLVPEESLDRLLLRKWPPQGTPYSVPSLHHFKNGRLNSHWIIYQIAGGGLHFREEIDGSVAWERGVSVKYICIFQVGLIYDVASSQ